MHVWRWLPTLWCSIHCFKTRPDSKWLGLVNSIQHVGLTRKFVGLGLSDSNPNFVFYNIGFILFMGCIHDLVLCCTRSYELSF